LNVTPAQAGVYFRLRSLGLDACAKRIHPAPTPASAGLRSTPSVRSFTTPNPWNHFGGQHAFNRYFSSRPLPNKNRM